MKTLIDAHSDRILGFMAFGPEAGELMGTVQLAMLAGCLIRCCETPCLHTRR